MLAEAGVAVNEAEVYAESIRRGGSLVSARIDADKRENLVAILQPSSVDIEARRSELASSGWRGFDPTAPYPTSDDVRAYRGKRGAGPA